jgi:hypothetical protein
MELAKILRCYHGFCDPARRIASSTSTRLYDHLRILLNLFQPWMKPAANVRKGSPASPCRHASHSIPSEYAGVAEGDSCRVAQMQRARVMTILFNSSNGMTNIWSAEARTRNKEVAQEPRWPVDARERFGVGAHDERFGPRGTD